MALADESAPEGHGERPPAKTLAEYADLMPEPGIGPLRFSDFPFQREWYSEEVGTAEEVVFCKGAQVSASAYGIRWGAAAGRPAGACGWR